MTEQDDRYPVGADLLRLEREERRFHREVNGTNHLSWKQLLRRVRPEHRYRVAHFGLPKVLSGEVLLQTAYETLVDRSCTYIDELRRVAPDYEIPVEEYWLTHVDPESGRTVVVGWEEDYWDVSFLIGEADEQVDEVDRYLELVGLSVESISERVIDQRCEETGEEDPEARADSLWAVRKAVARAMVQEYVGDRTLRQAVVIARARAAEAFDRAYGLARIRRAGADLDQHPEYRSLQAFYELGVRPPTHQEAADIVIRMFGRPETQAP